MSKILETKGAMKTEDAEVLTVNEMRALLKISRVSAYKAVGSGTIPSIRIGRRILVPKAALCRFLEQAGSKPAA